MAMDPEIRQAIEELRVLVNEAMKASGAIDKATGSASRHGERTTGHSPADARAQVAHGLPSRGSSSIPGYIAAGAMANTNAGRIATAYGSRMDRILDPQNKGLPGDAKIVMQTNTRQGVAFANISGMNGEELLRLTAATNRYGVKNFANVEEAWKISGSGSYLGVKDGIARQTWGDILPSNVIHWDKTPFQNQRVNRSFWRRTRNEYVSIAQGWNRKFGKGSWDTMLKGTGMTALFAMNAIGELESEFSRINAQEYDSMRDAGEQIRQRNVQIGQDMAALARLHASNQRVQAFQQQVKNVGTFAASQYIGMKVFSGGIMAGARAIPGAVLPLMIVQGGLRAYDYFSGADAARVEERVKGLQLEFRQQTGYQISKETQERALMAFTEEAVVRGGYWEFFKTKSSNLFGLLGDSEGAFQDEGARLAHAEYGRQAPKIQEARATLEAGGVYVAKKKFEEAAAALKIGDDMPQMWKNPQKWFSEMESSRIASRNFARSQMSRARARTGD